ncbi:MAG: hypothetical protein HYZ53_05125 [Planctomycetes bacterium]|nr:hypothetical protein [Planctomycetota bacterium]
MSRSLQDAIQALKLDPQQPVVAEVDGMLIELRVQGRPNADQIFREIGPWEGESARDLMGLLRQARDSGASKEPIVL